MAAVEISLHARVKFAGRRYSRRHSKSQGRSGVSIWRVFRENEVVKIVNKTKLRRLRTIIRTGKLEKSSSKSDFKRDKKEKKKSSGIVTRVRADYSNPGD